MQRTAAVDEVAAAEIRVVFGMVGQHRPRQDREVARGRHLLHVRQAVGVAEDGVAHAHLAGLPRHHLGEAGLAAAQRLGQNHRRVVGRLGYQREDRLLHADGLAGAQAQLGRRLRLRPGRHGQRLIQRQPACVERVEGQVERHHLGQGCRIGDDVGVLFVQHLARPGVHDDRRVFRRQRRHRGQHRARQRHCGEQNARHTPALTPRSASLPLLFLPATGERKETGSNDAARQAHDAPAKG